MQEFIDAAGILVNTKRVLAVKYQPELNGRVRHTSEHYKVVFDTGTELTLTPSEGAALLACYRASSEDCSGNANGMMAMRSEVAT